MSEAFVYVGTYTIQPGKVDEARKRCGELVDFVETNHPRMIAFHIYLDEPAEKLTVLQVHPDAASMELHMQINAKHFATAWDFLGTTVSEQFYGPTSESLEAELAKWDDPDVPVTRMPVHEAGFTRSHIH